MNKLLSSKLCSLPATIVSLFIFLQIFNYSSNYSTKRSLLYPFNHTFSTSFPRSPTWITSLPRHKKRLPDRDPNEKYLTFFTHSGFQNQLIQVENGILLAWYLNRTLILPKALLGEAFGWSQFSKLYNHHMLRDENNYFCQQFKDKKSRKRNSCPEPNKYAMASFDNLFDLSWAKQHVKIEEREYTDFDWLNENYGIKTTNKSNQTFGSYVDGDVLFFKDETRYDWRIYDIPTKHKFLGRYADSLDVTQLQNRPEKLIHFTSLFGTGKFPIKNPENSKFFKSLQKSIKYKHPAVLKITDRVIELLGGQGNFVGAHLRTADGLFVDAIPENIDSIIQNIGNNTHHTPLEKECTVNQLELCVSLAKSRQATLVFLATDAFNPRSDSKFQRLWQHAPCTFTLSEILPKNDPSWSHMDQYRTKHTGESMRRFLSPLVDALVASKGTQFLGTKGSTFSGYIRRLHKTQQVTLS